MQRITAVVIKRSPGIACLPNYANRPWCLMWQTPTMPTPAFWYYETEREARSDADRMVGR